MSIRKNTFATTASWNNYRDNATLVNPYKAVYDTYRENIVFYFYEMLCAAFARDTVQVTLDYRDDSELIDVEISGIKQTVNISMDSNQAIVHDIFRQLDMYEFM